MLRKQAEAKGVTPEQHARLIVLNTVGASPPPAELSTEEWLARFQAWIDSHKDRKYPDFVDDSRESVYEGCGE